MFFTHTSLFSSIRMDEKLQLFHLTLPGIVRYFESIFISYNGIQKEYGEVFQLQGKELSGNYLIGFSSFFHHSIICIIELDTGKSEYVFAHGFDIVSFSLGQQKHIACIWYSLTGEQKYWTSYRGGDEYELHIEQNYFRVYNQVFGTLIVEIPFSLKKNPVFLNQGEKKEQRDDIEIVDLYWYKDIFLESIGYEDFFALLQIYAHFSISEDLNQGCRSQVYHYQEEFFPKIHCVLSLPSHTYSCSSLREFQKLSFSFFCENLGASVIDRDGVEEAFFPYCKNLTSVVIGKIPFPVSLPSGIFQYDAEWDRFKETLFLLQHQYFILKKNQYKISHLEKGEISNAHLSMMEDRLHVSKQTLEITIPKYYILLSKLMSQIHTNILQK